MDYYKLAHLPSWNQLQIFCRNAWDGQFTMAKVFSGPNFAYISKLIVQDIKQVYGIDSKVKHAIMFINPGQFVQDLHVDGFEPDRNGASNTALNIPILNCDYGHMHWLAGKFTLSKKSNSSLKYLSINWEGEPQMVASTVINTPTFVKINVPHYIENKSNNPRLMLSVRLEPNISLENI